LSVSKWRSPASKGLKILAGDRIVLERSCSRDCAVRYCILRLGLRTAPTLQPASKAGSHAGQGRDNDSCGVSSDKRLFPTSLANMQEEKRLVNDASLLFACSARLRQLIYLPQRTLDLTLDTSSTLSVLCQGCSYRKENKHSPQGQASLATGFCTVELSKTGRCSAAYHAVIRPVEEVREASARYSALLVQIQGRGKRSRIYTLITPHHSVGIVVVSMATQGAHLSWSGAVWPPGFILRGSMIDAVRMRKRGPYSYIARQCISRLLSNADDGCSSKDSRKGSRGLCVPDERR